MSALDLLAVVNRGVLDDIEVGASIFSKTRQSGAYMVGGIVVEDNESDEWFAVLRFSNGQPTIDRIDYDDVDLGTYKLNGRDASRFAESLHTWLGGQRNLDRSDKSRWSLMAARLDQASLTGTWLPRATARFDAARVALQEQRTAS